MIEAMNKAFLCRLFSVSCKQDASDYEQNTLIKGMRLFFPWELDRLFFQELPEEIQSKIVNIYGVINEYSLRSRDVHFTPSWHKWSDFECPWCLAIVVRTPPDFHLIFIVTFLGSALACLGIFETSLHFSGMICLWAGNLTANFWNFRQISCP